MAGGSQVVENRVFVNGVPQTLGHSELATHFAQFGATKDIYLPMLFGTQQHKGIAFVTFDTPESQELALKYPSHVICGHQVSVSVCLAKGPNKAGHFPGSVLSPERLFVTGIPLEATQDEVQAYFKPYGSWSDFFMPRGHFAAGHKGMCFISFHSPASVQQVINSRPHTIRDQQVVCDIAAPREKGGGKGKEAAAAPAPFNGQMQLANAAQTAHALQQAAAAAVAQAGLPEGWAAAAAAAGGYAAAAGGQLGAAAGGFVNWNDMGADQLQAQSQQQALMFQQQSPQLDLQAQQQLYSYQQLQQAQYLQQSQQQQLSQQQLQMSVSQLQQQLQQPLQQQYQAPLQHLQDPQALQQLQQPQQHTQQPQQQDSNGLQMQQQPQQWEQQQPQQWEQPALLDQQQQQRLDQQQPEQQHHQAIYSSANQAIYSSATQPSNSQSAEMPGGVPVPGRLFLTKMSPDITKEDLTMYFKQFGTLNDVFVGFDGYDGKSIVFVGYDDPAVATSVAQRSSHEVKPGNFVHVSVAVERPNGFVPGGKGGMTGKHRVAPY